MNTRHTVNDDPDSVDSLFLVCLHIILFEHTTAIAFALVLNIPFHTDLIMLRDKLQEKIDTQLVHANARRTHYNFQPGMQVYVLTDHKSKLDPVYQGPYKVISVFI